MTHPLKIVELEFCGLTTVICGGQTGADSGGLFAAHSMNVETGGYAPRGWRTSDGANPNLAKYGLIEHEQEGYPGRTRANVELTDGTIIIASDPSSPGSRQTIGFCKRYNKPYRIFRVYENTTQVDIEKMSAQLSQWIIEKNIQALNVAGNRDRYKSKFHFEMAYQIVLGALLDLQSKNLLVSKSL